LHKDEQSCNTPVSLLGYERETRYQHPVSLLVCITPAIAPGSSTSRTFLRTEDVRTVGD